MSSWVAEGLLANSPPHAAAPSCGPGTPLDHREQRRGNDEQRKIKTRVHQPIISSVQGGGHSEWTWSVGWAVRGGRKVKSRRRKRMSGCGRS